jgi:hypothetical protein
VTRAFLHASRIKTAVRHRSDEVVGPKLPRPVSDDCDAGVTAGFFPTAE